MRNRIVGFKPRGLCARSWKVGVLSSAAFALILSSTAQAGNTNYGYDSLGRVTSVSYPNGSTITYQYDAAGNRTQVVRTRVNGQPVANADAANTAYGAGFTIDPRSNDSDPDGDVLTVTAVTQPGHGTTSFTGAHGAFSEDGLFAFGRGKRLICMDGYDLYETLDRGLSFADVLSRKVRRAAETGNPFLRVRDLFPA